MRILIDWDWAANGIWVVGSTGTTGALFLPEGLARPSPDGNPRPHRWRDRLSPDLRAALLAWNEQGEDLFGVSFNEHAELTAKQVWWARAAELAAAAQQQLGSECEVLYIVPNGAWRWVSPPWHRVKRT
jgi:PAS domain-containing protein